MTESRLDEFWNALDGLRSSASAAALQDTTTEASRLRRRNLTRYLDIMLGLRPERMLVGEAPGYRGTAVTGVPFMSVRELTATPGLLTGGRDGDGFEVPDAATSEWEATSAALWSTLTEASDPLPLLWAAFPLHPHRRDEPLTNRRPNANEIEAGLPVVLALIRAFNIQHVVAVGRVAQGVLAPHFPDLPYVRHPARGGAAQFKAQLHELATSEAARLAPRQ